MQDSVSVDLVNDEPSVGDVYLLCSDGLSGMLTDDQILEVVSSTPDTDEICKKLIRKANENGGEDNITALVVKFVDQPSDGQSLPPPSAEPRSAASTTDRGPVAGSSNLDADAASRRP